MTFDHKNLVQAKPADGWVVALRVPAGRPLTTCDQCGFKTSVLYRPFGVVSLDSMVCGVCMDEECDTDASEDK